MEKKLKCPFLFSIERYRLATQKNSIPTETHCIEKECAAWNFQIGHCGLSGMLQEVNIVTQKMPE